MNQGCSEESAVFFAKFTVNYYEMRSGVQQCSCFFALHGGDIHHVGEADTDWFHLRFCWIAWHPRFRFVCDKCMYIMLLFCYPNCPHN